NRPGLGPRQEIRIKQPGFKDAKNGRWSFAAAEDREQLEQIGQPPAWLSAVAHARQEPARWYVEVLKPAIDYHGVCERGETALNYLFCRPLTPWLEQTGSDLAEQRFRVVLQRPPQIV